MKASNYFHQAIRLEVASKNTVSPIEGWMNPKMRKRALQLFWRLTNTLGYIDTSKMNSALRTNYYIASQFRPSSAKCLYRLFDAKNVLDPSSGWGDRLASFLATPQTEKYLGFDPNISLHEKYDEQVRLYGKAFRTSLWNKKESENP